MFTTEKKEKKYKLLLGSRTVGRLKPFYSLARSGKFKLDIAGTEMEILRKASAEKPDLIIIDHDAPELDAVRCCSRLKSFKATSKIPVAIIGDATNKTLVYKAVKAGAVDFLVRAALDSNGVSARITRILDRHSGEEKTGPPQGSKKIRSKDGRGIKGGGSGRNVAGSRGGAGKNGKTGKKGHGGKGGAPGSGSGSKNRTAPAGAGRIPGAERSAAAGEVSAMSLETRPLLSKERFEKRLAEICDVKAMPHIVNEILKSISREDADVKEVVKIIEKEQAVVSRILRYANSSLFSIRTRIDSLQHAVVRIGFKRVGEIVMGLAVLDVMLKNRDADRALNRIGLWEHSLATAAISNMIAMNVGFKPPEHALLAGLLHDLGKAMLDDLFPDEYNAVIEESTGAGERLYDTEGKLLHLDHAGTGARVLRSWNLPDCFVDPAALHHLPWSKVSRMLSKDRKLVAIVRVADTLAKVAFPSWGGDDAIPPFSPGLIEYAGLTLPKIAGVLDQAGQAFSELTEIMDTPGDSGDDKYIVSDWHQVRALVISRDGSVFSLPAHYLQARGFDVKVDRDALVEPLIVNWKPSVIVIESAGEGFAGMLAGKWPDSKVLCLSDPGGPAQPAWQYLSGEPSGARIDAALSRLLVKTETER